MFHLMLSRSGRDANNFNRNLNRSMDIRMFSSILSGILAITCCALAASVKNPSSIVQDINKNQNVCLTPECIDAANTILSYMDSTEKPCNNFYSFVCGNFTKNMKIPDGSIWISISQIVHDTMLPKLQNAITAVTENDLIIFQRMKILYDLCMNEALIEKQGNTALFNIMQKMGGWPVLQGAAWNSKTFNWLDFTMKLRKFGYHHNNFMSVEVSHDLKNSSRYIIEIDQAGLRLPRQNYLNETDDYAMKASLKYMVNVAVLLGADPDRATQELTESLNFEKKLANITLPDEARRDFANLYNPLSVQELNKKFPSIPWNDFLNGLLAPVETVLDEDIINVLVPKFIPELVQLLEVTSERVQANYAMWSLVSQSVHFLGSDFRSLQLEYYKEVYGLANKLPRWKECTNVVSDQLNIGIGSLYVRKFVPKDVKKKVSEIFDDIRNTFEDILKKTEWMDNATKEKALEKAAAMTPHIAYPVELMDDRKLKEYHNGLTIVCTNYLDAFLNTSKFNLERTISRLRKPVNKTDWIDHGAAISTNPMYSPLENSITFPAGMLQGMYFNANRPKYMSYGGIGIYMGHEITHGFDDQGRTFDKNGNLADWWDKSTETKFLTRAQCIIDQYQNYTVEEVGLNLNGITTQGENIADNGGIKTAYFAYKDWVKRNGIEPQLPQLNYTNLQMFWINAAHIFCANHEHELLKRIIFSDSHSPGEFRVIGSFSNNAEFARDFDCQRGSKMAPEHTCSVW